ncbi:LOW QUALITY PROTEIN: G-protein coupled receptor GRL101-like [Amphiura filiformis]|uniref:LOW QUALITY PROTEIN: G-protein coupled receptor GRL101-like n=1 Tax=Amphiura filiformis TaxID=82378 RepID=UPI003B214252
MNISGLKPNSFDMFKGHKGLKKIDLRHNQISDLSPGLFTGLDGLRELHLGDNLLERIQSGIFHGMNALISLDLADNNLNLLENGAFKELPNLYSLDMQSNNLTSLKAPLFDSITSMTLLKLGNNHIARIDPFVFRHTQSILLLDLSRNKLDEIEPGTFQGLSELLFLFLADNDLTAVDCGTFSGLSRVSSLTLSNNKLTDIYRNTFLGLVGLRYLRLDENLLRKLDSTAFVELTSLASLDLRMNALDRVNIDTFDGITNQTKILVDNHSVCCFVKRQTALQRILNKCFYCGQLLPYRVLRVALAILGSLALVGNAMVLYWRCRIRRRDNKVQFLLIVNLSASDLLMGIYMMILVSGDVHFGERFPLEADAWRRSQICKVAGFLAVLSSEASVFFVTLISIDRLLGVKYPFSSKRLGNKSARLAIMGVWLLALTLSVVLTLLARIDPDMYALSEVCIGLPMARRWVNNQQNITVSLGSGNENVEIFETVRTEPGMYLSIAVFLGLNLLCFLAIAYCYIVIFITAQKTSRRASRRREKEEEIRMAAKMSVIVVTDFLCWMPIIIIGILVQSGAVIISPVVYAWIVTFVLPINSSANPFLYTIATILADRVGKRQKGNSLGSQCGKQYNGTHYYLTDTYEQVLNGHTGTICDSLSQEGNV